MVSLDRTMEASLPTSAVQNRAGHVCLANVTMCWQMRTELWQGHGCCGTGRLAR